MFFMCSCTNAKEEKMESHYISISVNGLEKNNTLFYKKERLEFKITIHNNSGFEILFPLDFVKKSGPSVVLNDRKTQHSAGLKRNLASHELLNKFTPIPPGQDLSFGWMIAPFELEQFGNDLVDVDVNIAIRAKIRLLEKEAEVRGSVVFRVLEIKPQ